MLISEAYTAFELNYLLNEDRTPKTIKEYRGRFFGKNGIVQVIGDIPMDQVGLDHVIRWKLHMREEGLEPATINYSLSGFRWFLKWCAANEMRVIDWRKVTFDKKELYKPHTVLTNEEMDQLLRSTKTLRDCAIIKLFFGTGMRSNELIQLNRLQWERAQIVNHQAIIEQNAEPIWELYILGKNDKWRPIYMYHGVKLLVDAYLTTRTDGFDPLFISQQNRRIHHNTISQMLHEATREAGLNKRVTQHVLRHTFATERAADGVPTPVLSYMLGHSSEATTQKIYTHIQPMHARQALSQHPPSSSKIKVTNSGGAYLLS